MILLLSLWILMATAQTMDDGSKIYFENELPTLRMKSPAQVPVIPTLRMKSPAQVPVLPTLRMKSSAQVPVHKVEKEKDRNYNGRQYVARGLRNLSINLDSIIRKNNPDQNTLFSPIPIANAMGLLLLGAKGKTALELSSFLGFKANVNVSHRPDLIHEELQSLIQSLVSSSGASNDSEISVGAAVFPNKWYGINDVYIEKAQKIYHSDVIPLDFIYHGDEAVKIINTWVSNATNNRITSIMEDIPPQSISIVLASAIYFNCKWKTPFAASLTKIRPFYTGKVVKGEEQFVNVQMMVNAAEVQYLDDKSRGLQMIGLPYQGEEIYMYIVLPEGELKQTLNQLKESDLKSMIQSCKKRTAIYMIPKMKLEAELHLESVLQQMGITLLFNPSTAELDNIAPKAYVNEIIHKVEIEVTETGTTGSAATLASLNRDGFTPVVRVERPFLFFIYHVKTDSMLFWGTVIKPTPHTIPKV